MVCQDQGKFEKVFNKLKFDFLEEDLVRYLSIYKIINFIGAPGLPGNAPPVTIDSNVNCRVSSSEIFLKNR
jgi:hypothetical protein